MREDDNSLPSTSKDNKDRNNTYTPPILQGVTINYTWERNLLEASWNVMAHAQKLNFFFRWSGRVHLNWRGRQFSRLLTAEVCASAWVMLVIPRSEVAWEYWLPTTFASFPFTSPPVRHRVPSHFNWNIEEYRMLNRIPTHTPE